MIKNKEVKKIVHERVQAIKINMKAPIKLLNIVSIKVYCILLYINRL